MFHEHVKLNTKVCMNRHGDMWKCHSQWQSYARNDLWSSKSGWRGCCALERLWQAVRALRKSARLNRDGVFDCGKVDSGSKPIREHLPGPAFLCPAFILLHQLQFDWYYILKLLSIKLGECAHVSAVHAANCVTSNFSVSACVAGWENWGGW